MDDDDFFLIPIIIFAVAVFLMCSCFGGCVYLAYRNRHKRNAMYSSEFLSTVICEKFVGKFATSKRKRASNSCHIESFLFDPHCTFCIYTEKLGSCSKFLMWLVWWLIRQSVSHNHSAMEALYQQLLIYLNGKLRTVIMIRRQESASWWHPKLRMTWSLIVRCLRKFFSLRVFPISISTTEKCWCKFFKACLWRNISSIVYS